MRRTSRNKRCGIQLGKLKNGYTENTSVSDYVPELVDLKLAMCSTQTKEIIIIMGGVLCPLEATKQKCALKKKTPAHILAGIRTPAKN